MKFMFLSTFFIRLDRLTEKPFSKKKIFFKKIYFIGELFAGSLK